MFPRIYLVVVCLCALCVGPLFAGTRLVVAGGIESVYNNRVGVYAPEKMPRLEVVADAPPVLRKHVALELALGLGGPFSPTTLPPEAVYIAYTTASWRSWYYLWDTRSRLSESIRLYWQSRRRPDGHPDGIEVGIGAGNYQNVGRYILVADDEQYFRHRIPEHRYYIRSGWCAEAFLRLVLLPSLPYGPVLTAGGQTSLGKSHTDSALSLALGWRFRV